MHKWAVRFLIAVALSGVAISTQASDEANKNIEVNWLEPEKFTDLHPSGESRKTFRKRVLRNLEAYFAELAEDLPPQQRLAITVTDIDLAGQVWPTFGAGNDVRIINRTFIPRIEFNYTLTSSGETLHSADVKLKEISFMMRSVGVRTSDPLRYEKSMLKRWFKEAFPKDVAGA